MDQQGTANQILDLQTVPLQHVDGSQFYSQPPGIREAVDVLNKSRGYLFVVPEYNGTFPGALKYFIDHWDYPKTFEYIPMAFIGMGSRFGGVRPVEHLQQAMNYRNAFVLPDRVFLFNVMKTLVDGKLTDEHSLKHIEKLTLDFGRFVSALEQAKLHGHHRG